MIHKLVLVIVLALSYFLLPQEYGFTFHSGLINHFIYPFLHANIWHLAANVACIFMITSPLRLYVTIPIAILCSFLPCFISEPTVGFSGVLFAIVGISWGVLHRFKDMVWKNKLILIIPVFLPHVNFMIHIYCLLAGYLYGHLCDKRLKT